MAVTKPYWYRNHVNTSSAIKMSCTPWLISVVITLVHAVYFVYKFERVYKYLAYAIPLVYYCFCSLIIIFSHLGIYFKKPPTVGIKEMRAVMKREKKSAVTVRLMLLVLVITFLPALLWPIVLRLKAIDNIILLFIFKLA